MLSRNWLAWLVGLSVAVGSAGCGSPSDAPSSLIASADAQTPVAPSPAARPDPVPSAVGPAKRATAAVIAAEKQASPLTSAADLAPPVPNTVTQAAPATAAEAIRAIDVRSLSRLNAKYVLNDSATYLYYSAQSSIAAAVGLYQSEMESRGWKLVPDSVPDNAQYRDMLFSKDGYYVRLTVGASGDEGIVGISLTNLGNVNLLGLPRIDGADAHPTSTPVNVSYKTAQGMPEAVKFCRDTLIELGWQPCRDMYSDPPEVPHVKQLNFCRNAVRLMVNVIRDPRLPNSDMTMISYLLLEAIPYDIPMIAGGTDLKLDSISGRATYATQASVADLVAFYQQVAPQVAWTLRSEADQISENHASLYVQDDKDLGFAIEISKEDNLTKVAFQRLSFKESTEPQEEPSPPKDATAASEPEPNDTASAIDDSLNDLQREIQDTVRKELQGVQDELKNLGIDIPANAFSRDDSNDSDAASDDDPVDKPATPNLAAFDGDAEQRQQQAESIQAADVQLARLPKLNTKCIIHYGDGTFELKHALAIRNPEDNVPTIMFCQEPLNVDRAQRKLARREAVSVLDLIGNEFPPAIEIQLQPGSTFISCFLDGASINRGSSDFKSELLAGSHRLRGTVSMAEAEEVFDKSFRFEATFDQDLLGYDPGAREALDKEQLASNSNYDLPVPEDCEGVTQEKSPYRTVITAPIRVPLAHVLDFYRRELNKLHWTEDAAQTHSDATSTRLAFSGSLGLLSLVLKQDGDITQIELTTRNEQKARQDGLVPTAGQGLLMFANAGDKEVAITLNQRTIKLPAGIGAQDPANAVKVPVLPGKHLILLGTTDKAKREEVVVEAGTTWGVIAIPGGEVFAQILY